MIDIHSHVLFDIDDGAESIDISIEMCDDSYQNGCDILVLTPHLMDFRDIDDFVEERNARISILRKALASEEIPLKLCAGAELYLSDQIFNAGNLDEVTINGSRYILCEMPLEPFDTRNVTKWFDELLDRGYTPILAHPERYYEFHQNFDLIDEILDRGVIFQVNIDSLIGQNGAAAQDMAIDMVCLGIAPLVASDAHDLEYRHTRLIEKLNELPDEIPEELIEKCFHKNPEKILNNENIDLIYKK